ncbi:MAG: HAMP domain-containing protein [Bacteroidetes bacterium]|nr:HAMP domain-containing protein [Bacteroidota bacterium]
MSTSYKERIARRLTGVTALLFLCVFILIYLVANFTVVRNIDRDLDLEIEKHQDELVIANGKISFLHSNEWEEMEHSQIQLNPIFIEIVDVEGKSMDRSPNLREFHLSFLPQKSHTEEAWTQKLGSREVRQRQIPLVNSGKIEGYLLLAKSFEDARELLDNLRNVLLVIYPILLITLYLSMRYLAGKSIEPLEKISQKTNQITQQNLGERVPDLGTNDEIGQLTLAINSLLGRLEQAMQREKQFTSDASHELRTPLSVLRGTLEVLIRKERSASEYEEKIKTALGSIDRMSAMLDQLLALARVENGKNLVQEELELITFLEELADKFSSEQQQRITFQSLVGMPIYVRTQEKSLEMILTNLSENAVKYSEGKEGIFLRVGKKDKAFIEVEDAGSGINPEHLEKIFDPFFREKEALDKGIPGTGLGLAIVKKLAEESAIQLSVTSKKNKGSIFKLEFSPSS